VKDAPVDLLVASIRRYLHFPDPGIIYVLMGAVAANMLDGYPVWLMLVGAPGDGKTELLNALLGIPHTHPLANISNETAFLSATGVKERAKDATGGILRQVGEHGAVVLNDFTSVLGLEPRVLSVVLTVFRESFSGGWTRHVGVDGGREIRGRGGGPFLAGVTGEIDKHHQVSASLGERWVYYRMREDEVLTYEKTRRALLNAGREGWREELKDLVAGFFAGLDLKFRGRAEDSKRRDLTDVEMTRIIRIGSISARCRSAVVRDPYSKEILGVRETEVGTRLSTVLGQLLVGMEAIGVDEDDRWRLIGKVGLDSMPKLRRMIIDLVLGSGRDGVGVTEITDTTKASRAVVERAVEDLEVHGVVELVNIERKKWVRMDPKIAEELRKWQ